MMGYSRLASAAPRLAPFLLRRGVLMRRARVSCALVNKALPAVSRRLVSRRALRHKRQARRRAGAQKVEKVETRHVKSGEQRRT